MFALVLVVILLLMLLRLTSDKSARRSMKVGYPFDPFNRHRLR